MIQFDKTTESLEDFVEKMCPGEIHVKEDLFDEALEEFEEEMPEIAREVDEHYPGMNIHYQLRLLRELYEKILEEREPPTNFSDGDADDDDCYDYDHSPPRG